MKNGKPGADEPQADKYVADIMRRHAADTHAAPAPRQSSHARAWLAGLVTILLVLFAANLYLVLRRPEVVSPAKEEASARLTVYLVAQAIQAHRDSTHALPRDLTDLGVDDVGITYTPRESTYTLAVTLGQTELTYQSGESLEPYRRAALTLLQGLR